jgi:hypothetical protein
LLAFVLGLLGITFTIFNDPRARFLRRDVEPLPLPADAVVASRRRQALAATLPSTLGVTGLAAIALVPQPVLAALLGGVCAGLGLAALLSLGRIGIRRSTSILEATPPIAASLPRVTEYRAAWPPRRGASPYDGSGCSCRFMRAP